MIENKKTNFTNVNETSQKVLLFYLNFFYKMLDENSKILNPKANVVNEVEVVEKQDSSILQLQLWIIIFFIGIQLGLKLFLLHKKSLKRKYLNRAASVAEI